MQPKMNLERGGKSRGVSESDVTKGDSCGSQANFRGKFWSFVRICRVSDEIRKISRKIQWKLEEFQWESGGISEASGDPEASDQKLRSRGFWES
jgi:hypothetical protein